MVQSLPGFLNLSLNVCSPCQQGRSKLFKSAGDGCSLFVNNKKDEFNDRRVQKV